MVCLVISSPAVALDQAGIEWEKKHQIVYDVKAALINCNLLWDRTITKGERINEASMFCSLPTNETLNVPFDKEKLTVGTSYSKTTPFDIEQYIFPNGQMWKKKVLHRASWDQGIVKQTINSTVLFLAILDGNSANSTSPSTFWRSA
jgi:hypothetical protein